MRLNIGGGKNFNHSGWINLDAVTGFTFTPTCTFDIQTGSMELVYSSHCLEHLDDATVEQVLAEARRVLAPHGRLVIVLPNFDDVLHQYRSGNRAYFDQPVWGLDSVAWTWPHKSIPDNIATRCSMIFCGFWNKAWGDHFGVNRDIDPQHAYHGPSPMIGIELDEALQDMEPHELSQCLAGIVRNEETDFTFNHQNAWTERGFMDILEGFGFENQSPVKADIPGIFDMMPISTYYEAIPV